MSFQEGERPRESVALDIASIERKSGIGPEDAEQPWKFRAREYSAILWAVASTFARNECETTHFEFQKFPDGGKTELAMCTVFFKRTYDEFCAYLQSAIEVVPSDLRKQFTMKVGFNYENDGGIAIDETSVRRLTQEELEQGEELREAVGLARPAIRDGIPAYSSRDIERFEYALYDATAEALKRIVT